MLLPSRPSRTRLVPAALDRSFASGAIPTVAIVTMTLARNFAEARLLEQSLAELSKTGWPMFVGDGGSDMEFVQRLAQLRRVQVLRPAPGRKRTLVNQLLPAFERAQEFEPDYFLYTEPDKRSFFKRGVSLLARAGAARDGRAPDLVVAARSAKAFASFPPGQQAAESIMNQICGEAFEAAGDYTYGPLLISRRLVEYVRLIPENLGWGWRFFLMAVAHQLGMDIALCTVPSYCPRSQRAEDDDASRRYRLRQLEQNMTGLGNGWIRLLDEPLLPEVLTA